MDPKLPGTGQKGEQTNGFLEKITMFWSKQKLNGTALKNLLQICPGAVGCPLAGGPNRGKQNNPRKNPENFCKAHIKTTL